MFVEKNDIFGTRDGSAEQRRHPRQTVFKSALLYPIIREANLTVKNISPNGLSGHCALTLSLREQVHVSLDDEKFVTAEVRWTMGSKCGLLMEEPLLWLNGDTQIADPSGVGQSREPRMAVEISATLVITAPVLVGTIRNRSVEGMMIEADGLREGTLVLVKTRGLDVRMGRVQWASGGMVGIFFDPLGSRR